MRCSAKTIPTTTIAAGLVAGLLATGACGDNLRAGDADAAPAGADAAPADAMPPPPPGLLLFDYAIAVDVTPDGHTAVFENLTQAAADVYFVDTVTGTATMKTTVGDPGRDLATGVSNAGRLTALHGDPVQAGVWDEATGWKDLASPFAAPCDQDFAGGWDVSADGKVVVGMLWDTCNPVAFRWTETGGGAGVITPMQVLGVAGPSLAAAPSNRATVVSDDGRIAAGFAQNGNLDRSAAIWGADGHGFLLDPAAADAPSEILSIDADGGIAAGIEGYDGFVWTQAAGKTPLVRFDAALPSDPVYPNAMTADGQVVFGGVGDAFFSIPVAFAWTHDAGMRPLVDLARAAGVTVPDGLVLGSVLGASADGTVLAGVATDGNGQGKAFVLRLPAGAYQP
jgi:hypothetical protein